jgi:Tol biopolymer transport system component
VLFQIPSVGGPPRKRIYDVAGNPTWIEQGDGVLTFSPDGKRICFHRESHTPQGAESSSLIVFDLETEEERTLAKVQFPERFTSPSWSPDGKRIAAALSNGGQYLTDLVLFEVGTGRRGPAGSRIPWWIQDLAWLPDGRTIGIAAGSPEFMYTQIWTLSVPGGQLRRITDDWAGYTGALSGLSVSADGTHLATARWDQTYNLWAVEASAGAKGRQITDFSTGTVYSANWTRNGREIVYTYGTEVTDAVLISHFR